MATPSPPSLAARDPWYASPWLRQPRFEAEAPWDETKVDAWRKIDAQAPQNGGQGLSLFAPNGSGSSHDSHPSNFSNREHPLVSATRVAESLTSLDALREWLDHSRELQRVVRARIQALTHRGAGRDLPSLADSLVDGASVVASAGARKETSLADQYLVSTTDAHSRLARAKVAFETWHDALQEVLHASGACAAVQFTQRIGHGYKLDSVLQTPHQIGSGYLELPQVLSASCDRLRCTHHTNTEWLESAQRLNMVWVYEGPKPQWWAQFRPLVALLPASKHDQDGVLCEHVRERIVGTRRAVLAYLAVRFIFAYSSKLPADFARVDHDSLSSESDATVLLEIPSLPEFVALDPECARSRLLGDEKVRFWPWDIVASWQSPLRAACSARWSLRDSLTRLRHLRDLLVRRWFHGLDTISIDEDHARSNALSCALILARVHAVARVAGKSFAAVLAGSSSSLVGFMTAAPDSDSDEAKPLSAHHLPAGCKWMRVKGDDVDAITSHQLVVVMRAVDSPLYLPTRMSVGRSLGDLTSSAVVRNFRVGARHEYINDEGKVLNGGVALPLSWLDANSTSVYGFDTTLVKLALRGHLSPAELSTLVFEYLGVPLQQAGASISPLPGLVAFSPRMRVPADWHKCACASCEERPLLDTDSIQQMDAAIELLAAELSASRGQAKNMRGHVSNFKAEYSQAATADERQPLPTW